MSATSNEKYSYSHYAISVTLYQIVSACICDNIDKKIAGWTIANLAMPQINRATNSKFHGNAVSRELFGLSCPLMMYLSIH
jgi:hypothetical protein